MLNKRLTCVECDGCGVINDGDPMDIIGQRNSAPSHFSPEKVDLVTYFWLCAQCAPEYPNGIKDVFREDFWEEVHFCANCKDEEVDEPNHWCDYCADNLDPDGDN